MTDLSSWTEDALAGQRLFIGFEGPEATPGIRNRIRSLRPCGIILFATNIQSPGQVRELVGSLKEEARSCGMPELLVAIDQEGGPVARLREPAFREFPGIATLGKEARVRSQTLAMARQLEALGITMNFAPVLDVASLHPESVMASRSFPGTPQDVARLGGIQIRTFEENGILAVAKHFPGIGRTVLDSHFHLPDLPISQDALERTDLLPFRAALSADVSGVMVSHVRYPGIDPDWPASLSKILVTDLLRKKMGFSGVVMTDDLDMKAIRIPIETSMEQIVAADVDLAMICHEGPDIENGFSRLALLARSHRGAFERSVLRILHLKSRLAARRSDMNT